MLVCYQALSRYDTAGIQSGAVQRLIDAAMRMTGELDSLIAWAGQHKCGDSLHRIIVRLDTMSRHVLDANAELQMQGAEARVKNENEESGAQYRKRKAMLTSKEK